MLRTPLPSGSLTAASARPVPVLAQASVSLPGQALARAWFPQLEWWPAESRRALERTARPPEAWALPALASVLRWATWALRAVLASSQSAELRERRAAPPLASSE